MKVQTIHACNGIVMDVTKPFPGSVHDTRIFDESDAVVLFQGHRWEEGETKEVRLCGMFDLG
jgi:hypothetical protein